MRMLILYYTIQVVVPNVCTKFQNPRYSSPKEIFNTNFSMHYIGLRDGKKEKNKAKYISASWFSFIQYTSTVCRCIQNLKTLTIIGPEQSVKKNFMSEKEKWTNKGNDPWGCWFSLTQYKSSNVCTKFQYPWYSSSWEIFDGKKVHTDRQTMLTEKTETIYSLYTLYARV